MAPTVAPDVEGQNGGLLARLEGAAWQDERLYRRPLRLACIVLREFSANAVSMRAAALTYAIVLSLVPLLALSTAMFKGLGGDDHLRQLAELWLNKLEPPAAELLQEQPDEAASPATVGGHLREAVATVFAYVDRTSFATLGLAGVLGLLLTVLMVLGQIEGAMNVIWHGARGRPLLRRLLDYLALLVLLPLAVNIALAAGTILNNPAWLGTLDTLLPFGLGTGLALNLLPLVFVVPALLALYIFFPNVPVRTGPALIASLTAGLAWLLLQRLYLMLQLVVANYNAIYGSFATLPLFLIWLFLGWNVILGGAVLAHAIQHQERFRPLEAEPPPVRRLQLAFDLLAEVNRCFAARRPCGLHDLRSHLAGCETRDLLQSAALLTRGGLLRGDLLTADGLMPAAPISDISADEVVHLVLGERDPSSPATSGSRLAEEIVQAARQEARRHTLPGSPGHDAAPAGCVAESKRSPSTTQDIGAAHGKTA